jgi:hypothetical protein
MEDTVSQILSNTYGMTPMIMPTPAPIVSPWGSSLRVSFLHVRECTRIFKPKGHIRARSFFCPIIGRQNFSLANWYLPVYYLVLRWPDPVGECVTGCVSVSAVRYRAFVYASPQHVAGKHPVKCSRVVSVGVVSPRAATPA